MLRKTVMPIPPATKTRRPRGVLGEHKIALGRFDFDFGADRKLAQRSFEGAVSHPRREAENALLVRGGDDRDVPAQTLVVLVADVREVDEEVLTRAEVDLLAEEVERHQQGALRDLPLFLDARSHRPSGRQGP
jgi:hypothetical protein